MMDQHKKYMPPSSRRRRVYDEQEQQQDDGWNKWMNIGEWGIPSPVERSTSTTTATTTNGWRSARNRGEVSRQIQQRRRTYGRGYFVEPRLGDSGVPSGFRKADRPLQPENKAEVEKWEPRVMNPAEMVTLAAHCIELSDTFIKLDTYFDTMKKFNPSNHNILRTQRMHPKLMDENVGKYAELIKQCIANPGKFEGTYHCLRLVIGDEQLGKYIAEHGWTVENLKSDYDIITDWLNEPRLLSMATSSISQLSSTSQMESKNNRRVESIPVYSISSDDIV